MASGAGARRVRGRAVSVPTMASGAGARRVRDTCRGEIGGIFIDILRPESSHSDKVFGRLVPSP